MAGGPKTSNGGGSAKPKRVVLTKNQKKHKFYFLKQILLVFNTIGMSTFILTQLFHKRLWIMRCFLGLTGGNWAALQSPSLKAAMGIAVPTHVFRWGKVKGQFGAVIHSPTSPHSKSLVVTQIMLNTTR